MALARPPAVPVDVENDHDEFGDVGEPAAVAQGDGDSDSNPPVWAILTANTAKILGGKSTTHARVTKTLRALPKSLRFHARVPGAGQA